MSLQQNRARQQALGVPKRSLKVAALLKTGRDRFQSPLREPLLGGLILKSEQPPAIKSSRAGD